VSVVRTGARQTAVQALYQWQMTGQNLNDIEQQFYLEWDVKKAQRSYFKELLHGIPSQLDVLDQALAEFVDREVDKIDPVERAILRIGVYELFNRPDVPYKVVLNESINLAKRYGASESHKYVNSVLDKIAHKQRSTQAGTGPASAV